MTLDADLIHFIVTTAFSFLIGLEIKTYRQQFHREEPKAFFGTARTYTFIGILGYVFYRIDPHGLVVYTAGLAVLSVMYALFYRQRLEENRPSILLFVVMLCVYTFGPLTQLFALWMPALLFVLIVFVLNAKPTISRFTGRVNAAEFETMGKMVLLSVVILPLLPDTKTIPYVPLSPFKIWLAVVVISGISYGGYIVQKYFFPSKGYFLTGIFGGTYSSTATTVVLAKKARHSEEHAMLTAGIVAATSMMYLRLLVVAAVFNLAVAKTVALPLLGFALLSFAVAGAYYYRGAKERAAVQTDDANPLELETAFLFAGLFVVMMVLTQFVTQHYGSGGLKVLSFVVGFTDIDPFILSLLTGKYSVSAHDIYAAIIIAAGSNNILKAVYALWFGGWKQAKYAFVWLLLLGVVTIAAGWFVPPAWIS